MSRHVEKTGGTAIRCVCVCVYRELRALPSESPLSHRVGEGGNEPRLDARV